MSLRMNILVQICLVWTTTILVASCFLTVFHGVTGFVLPHTTRRTCNCLLRVQQQHQNSPIKFTVLDSVSRNAEFEYQEMKVLLDALQREKIVSSNRMDRTKANELNCYIQRIISDRVSSISFSSSVQQQQQQQQQQQLYNTSWTMMYTTMDILPPDTTIQLKFLGSNDATTTTTTSSPTYIDTNTDRHQQKMQYRLLFGSKTFGLKSLNVYCDWTLPYMDSINSINNNAISFTYDTISMDAFGWNNIHLCFISDLFRGRTNVINTVYCDDNIWIEQQEDPMENNYQTIYNNDVTAVSVAVPPKGVVWNVYRKDIDES